MEGTDKVIRGRFIEVSLPSFSKCNLDTLSFTLVSDMNVITPLPAPVISIFDNTEIPFSRISAPDTPNILLDKLKRGIENLGILSSFNSSITPDKYRENMKIYKKDEKLEYDKEFVNVKKMLNDVEKIFT